MNENNIVVNESNKKIGLKVRRGPNWTFDDQDTSYSNHSGLGVIIDIANSSEGWVTVVWNTGYSNQYPIQEGNYGLYIAEDFEEVTIVYK